MDPMMIAAVARLEFDPNPEQRRAKRRRRSRSPIPSRVFYQHPWTSH